MLHRLTRLRDPALLQIYNESIRDLLTEGDEALDLREVR